ncbi:hypothetical protein JD844_004186 [Phrynosoma platyrhinos]|uniref:Arrestin-C n=1 Tax=Phrynosoma platyrhinos TaxID=52577 RepID=A0ABQ7TMY1_PHRPL|nr:hypothetical protein JD844_004186 [Phrynosoma platyrhinos]
MKIYLPSLEECLRSEAGGIGCKPLPCLALPCLAFLPTPLPSLTCCAGGAEMPEVPRMARPGADEPPLSPPLCFFPQNLGRVYKKTCPNGKLSIYLGKRDFVDHVESVEPVDGVVLIDPEYLKDRKVYVTLTCAFRYGRDDLDVIGLTFRKDLYVLTTQIFPPVPDQAPKTLTPLQDKLMKKLGENAYPFTFEMATNLPCSVTLQPGPDDAGKSCGVDFEVKGFCAENLEEKIHKRNSVRLVIRKIQFAPVNTGPAPKSETTRQFMMSDKPLHLEASLDKEIYYHGDPIGVNVNINNTTNKIVKKIKISDIRTEQMFSELVLLALCSENVAANSTFSKSYTVTPSLSNNREKRGLALDGKLKHEDTNLASTTVLRPGMDKEVLGILVSYKVKVNLMVSRGGILGDLTSSAEDIVIEEFARQKLKGEKDDEEKEEEDKEES